MEHITYTELKAIFCAHESVWPREHLTANIVFTEDSYISSYSLAARTYTVSSDNKAFLPGMRGYSIFGDCADGTDPCVRLEQYMAEEQGGADGWRVEYCYMARLIERGSDHISIDGHSGTWYVIDEGTYKVPGARGPVRCFLLEHETYGDEAAHIIVSASGVVLLDDVWNGFDDLVEAGWMPDIA